MLGYAIFNINVTNPEDYKEYLQKVVPITETVSYTHLTLPTKA